MRWLDEVNPPNPLAKRFKRLALLLFMVIALWNLLSYLAYTNSGTIGQSANDNSFHDDPLDNTQLEDAQSDARPHARPDDTRTDDTRVDNSQPDGARLDDAELDDMDETGLSGYDRSLNLAYCGRKVCKWLFVYSQNEQESRANKWFRAWNAAAEAMDRVVVLPHVGSSHIRSCMKKPFDFYYDIEDLKRRYPKVTFVHQDRFVEWAKLRRQVPTMRWMGIEINRTVSKDQILWRYEPLDMAWVKKKSCMKDVPLQPDPTPLNMTRADLPDMWWRTIRKKTRADVLESMRASNADVLMIQHGNVNPDIWPGSESPPLKYADRIYDAANHLTEAYLRPFVAVHWRMENSTYNNLPECARAMADWLPKFAARHGIDRIYFASDYPITGGINAQSTSWHKIPQPSHEAFQIIKTSLEFETWMTVLDKDLKEQGPRLSELGDGVQSIIDKLVCENADYFVTPPKACRKPYSNWTRAVVAERLKKQNDPNVKNIVDEFPKPSTLRRRAHHR